MSRALLILKQQGQIMSSDLASLCDMNERKLVADLYPSVASGAVMACTVVRDGEKVGIEYRMSGTFPKVRPGPKIGATQEKRA